MAVRIELIKNKIQKLKNRRYPPLAAINPLETQLQLLSLKLRPYRPFRDVFYNPTNYRRRLTPKPMKFRSVTTIAPIPHSTQVAQSKYTRIGKEWKCPCGKVLRWIGPSAAAKHQGTASCKSKRLATI
jgi:hypothetical protein